jgi:hypothetical protein
MMLKDLVSSPSVLSRLRVMNILAISQNLSLATVERPRKDNFMLTPTTVGTCHSIRNGLIVGHTKLESDLFLGKTEGFGGVFDIEVNLIRTKRFRHNAKRLVVA